MRVRDDYLQKVLEGQAFLIEDGAFGTMLQQAGLTLHGEKPDILNLTHPAEVTHIHEAYIHAGSQMITTNTFGANGRKLAEEATVEEVVQAAVANARAAIEQTREVWSSDTGRVAPGLAPYVALDLGPTGTLLEPTGTLSFDEAYGLFKEQIVAAQNAGVDVIYIETMSDLRETKAALLAAKEQSDLPVFATMTFQEDGRTFLGTSPSVAAATLSALGASAIGINCSLGPAEIAPLIKDMTRFASCPIIAKPNAGLPQMKDGRTVYPLEAARFAEDMDALIEEGVTIVGGCCGTSPEYIAELAEVVKGHLTGGGLQPDRAAFRTFSCEAAAFIATSAQQMVVLPEGSPRFAVVGERINPTGNKGLRVALQEENLDAVVALAVEQQRAGADILDVNVGLPGADEPALMTRAVESLLATTTMPLQIDSSDPATLERAVRSYPGKPIINSVNGKRQSLDAVLPIAKRYGTCMIGLTLDEDGIPETAEGRVAIARRIVDEAEERGISRADIAIDCLVMSVATSQALAPEILKAIRLVKAELGVKTALGVSNISHGLPDRPLLNATFLAAAVGAGLDLAIIDPADARMRDAIDGLRVLDGQDENAFGFIDAHADRPSYDPYAMMGSSRKSGSANKPVEDDRADQGAFAKATEASITALVLAGRGDAVADEVRSLLGEGADPLAIISDSLIPALDEVGARYDRGDLFLPQLLAASEAVKAGFDLVRAASDEVSAGASSDHSNENAIILATVEGDIHDIGKNIVKMLLENYGFTIIDLGKDVSAETIADTVEETGSKLVGLSALMTTTAPAMAETIALIKERGLDAAVMVGGAVITPEFAASIGADHYAKDAASSVCIAQEYYSAVRKDGGTCCYDAVIK